MCQDSRLSDEAKRQGEEYSRKLREEYQSFWGHPFWDFVRRKRASWMLDRLAEAAPGRKSLKFLEVGCGIGFTAFEVAKSDLVHSLRAIDMSEAAIAEARRLQEASTHPSRRKISFQVGNYFKEVGCGQFDCLYMHEVFEHIPDSRAVFAKAAELLKPDGFFMISTPNRLRLLNRLLPLIGRAPIKIDPFHIEEFTLDEMTAPRSGWLVTASSGRILLDEFALGAILSFGSRAVFRFLAPLVSRLTRNPAMYYAGGLIPQLSTELLILYRRS